MTTSSKAAESSSSAMLIIVVLPTVMVCVLKPKKEKVSCSEFELTTILYVPCSSVVVPLPLLDVMFTNGKGVFETASVTVPVIVICALPNRHKHSSKHE